MFDRERGLVLAGKTFVGCLSIPRFFSTFSSRQVYLRRSCAGRRQGPPTGKREHPLETARLTPTQIPEKYNKRGKGLGPPHISASDIFQVTRVVFATKRIRRK